MDKQLLSVNGNSSEDTVRNGISRELLDELTRALKAVRGWGSIEIYVQDFSVTQITVRNIRKTKHVLAQ
ncbi:MAG: hypothetical protein AAB874_07255 [Patescibacteria group bacterium]